MIESLALDAFLVLILILLVPIGMYRGGLREVCSAAGLMLAYLVAVAWSDPLGQLVGGPRPGSTTGLPGSAWPC